MAERYLPLLPRTRTRLTNEVFNTIAINIYDREAGRTEHESQFNNLRSALIHLLMQRHYETDIQIVKAVEYLQNLSHKKQSQKIAGVVDEVRRILLEGGFNPAFTQQDIDCFIKLGTAGRRHFEDQGYDPDEFIESKLITFATMIKEKFSAYEKTLNHTYI